MPEPITIIVCSDCGEPIDDPNTNAGVTFGTTTTWEDHLSDGCGPQPMPTELSVDEAGNLVVAQWQPELGDPA